MQSFKKKLGQNTAEYMLLLLLVGGGSIVAFKFFGAGVINRFTSIVQVMTGGAKKEFKDTEAPKENIDFTTFDAQETKK